jgi:hypothetical protein
MKIAYNNQTKPEQTHPIISTGAKALEKENYYLLYI